MLNERQIRERADLVDAEVIAQLQAISAKATNSRFGTPLPMRYTPVPFGAPIGWKPVNYLLEVGFTRDVWAHRIDIHAVIGRPMELDPAHDGRLDAATVETWTIDRFREGIFVESRMRTASMWVQWSTEVAPIGSPGEARRDRAVDARPVALAGFGRGLRTCRNLVGPALRSPLGTLRTVAGSQSDAHGPRFVGVNRRNAGST